MLAVSGSAPAFSTNQSRRAVQVYLCGLIVAPPNQSLKARLILAIRGLEFERATKPRPSDLGQNTLLLDSHRFEFIPSRPWIIHDQVSPDYSAVSAREGLLVV